MNLRRNALGMVRGVLRALPFARPASRFPDIADLAVIGDRHTAAVVSTDATVNWYCPGCFDAPSLFGGLLDPALAGSWRIELNGAAPKMRRYLDSSAVLETTLGHRNGTLTVTDWMNLGQNDVPHGLLCRTLTAAPDDLRIVLAPRPGYGARIPPLRRGTPSRVVIDDRYHLHASHNAAIRGGRIEVGVPKGERSWVVLSDGATATPLVDQRMLDKWLSGTLDRWAGLGDRCRYDGPWAEQVRNSVRALHLLVYEQTGAIAAAVTADLPEVIGGDRNYDYRYSWLRDSALVVRGLLRFETDPETVCRHLGVFAKLRATGHRPFLDPVYTVGGERVPMPTKLPLSGYRSSRPVLAGNSAAKQLQLGSLANFLLGVKEIHQSGRPGFLWEMAEETIEFLIENWSRKGHGIWEEKEGREYTAGRVFAVCAIEGLARYSADRVQQDRWRQAAGKIRAAVEKSFHTPSGAYAATRGSTGVDITAALFPVWGYCTPDDPTVSATMREIELRYSRREGLFHRHLEKGSARRREGSFLAGTFWIAHYWALRGEFERARRLIDIGLSYATDLGLFAEEVDDRSGKLLGNLPLGLVHGSFLSALADYHELLGRTRRAKHTETTFAS